MKSVKQVFLTAILTAAAVAAILIAALLFLPDLSVRIRGGAVTGGEVPSRTAEHTVSEPPAVDVTEPVTTAAIQTQTVSALPVTTATEPEPVVPDDGLIYEPLGNRTCKVVGLNDYPGTCVIIPEVSPAGDRVVEIADHAFFGCQGIAVVRIPASVERIGRCALSDCPDLIYVSVDPGNPAFRDENGVLFSADLQTLILCPCAFPSAQLTLPPSVRTIADMALYHCRNLRSVVFE